MAIESLLGVYLIGTRREIKGYSCNDIQNESRLGLIYWSEFGVGMLCSYLLPEHADKYVGYTILADAFIRWASGIYNSFILGKLESIPENSGLIGKIRQIFKKTI